MQYAWYDFVGNLGIIMVLGTYLAIQMGKMNAQQLSYLLWNGFGAILIMISLFFAFNLSSFLIELAWLGISLFGVFTYLSKHKNKH